MAGPLYHIGQFCARRHWPVIAIWLVVVIGLAAVGRAVGEQTSDNLSLPGTNSTNATNLLEKKLPDQAYGSSPVVLKASKGKLTDSDNKKAVDDAVTSLDKAPHVIKTVNPTQQRRLRPSEQGRDDRLHTRDAGPEPWRPRSGSRRRR